MGNGLNCLKSMTNGDDESLLTRDQTPGTSNSVPDLLPPPYQESSGHGHHHHHRRSRSHRHQQPSTSGPSLSEEEQVKLAQRMGLINHLPCGSYDGSKKNRECVICMEEFLVGDMVRYLPCLHIYHTVCIDDWLMRGSSFSCPSCMEPVEDALVSTYRSSQPDLSVIDR